MSFEDGYRKPAKRFTKDQEKTWSVVVHAVGIVFEFFGPLVGYLLFRENGPFIRHHVTESLNFGITVTLGLFVLAISVVGWALIWAVPIYWTIFRIIAALKASQGEFYRYPLTIRFVKI